MNIKNTLRIYNTLSREVEDFVPLDEGKVKMYACGPTVYDYPHIGNIRKYVMDDVLIRLMRYLGYEVTHVMNITDVGHLASDDDSGEDKMEKGARKMGKTAWEVAKFFEEYFFNTMDRMLVGRPTIVCRATEHIKEQIELIQKLEQEGFIYKIDDGIYFDSTKFPDYGKLAQLDIEHLQAGARVEMVAGKKHAVDFALWKLTPLGVKRDMEWDSPWGKGFPGWHVECSAMSMKYLGETLDIHTGGIDHIPLHHTNEIAQSEAATGKPFVKYWVHHNFLFVNGAKMSKSAGTFITLDDVLAKGFKPRALRYLMLQTHYRGEMNFTWEALQGAQTALHSLKNQLAVIQQQMSRGERNTLSEEKLEKVNMLRKKFKDVIRMDLNTPQALGIMWEILKSSLPATDKYDLLMIADEIFGLGLKDLSSEYKNPDAPAEIIALSEKRQALRLAGKFAEADKIREEIEQKGWIMQDKGGEVVIKKKTDGLYT